jgi:hypothetical protein
MTKCYLLTPTDRVRRSLRVYDSDTLRSYQCPRGYHEAWRPIDEVPAIWKEDPTEPGRRILSNMYRETDFAGDARWPTHCDHCGAKLTQDHTRQVFTDLIYRRSDTGADETLREAKPGAMWDAWWYSHRRGPDGRCLIVICPDGRQWMIDSRASNCTMKDDHVHRCWVRHGEPPNITVDKNGHTCAAGGGSIDTGTFHGFLRNGAFTSC